MANDKNPKGYKLQKKKKTKQNKEVINNACIINDTEIDKTKTARPQI